MRPYVSWDLDLVLCRMFVVHLSYSLPLCVLQFYFQLLACVRRRSIRFRANRNSGPVVIFDQDNIERPRLQHAGIVSPAIRNCQRSAQIIPGKRDSGTGPLFVIVIVVFVLVKSELSVGTRINPQLDRIGRLFGRVLQERPHRDN